MDDINRPLRRLEIAERIKELRQRAATGSLGAQERVSAPEALAAEPVTPEPVTPESVTPEPVADEYVADEPAAPPAVGPGALPDTDDSAATTIASLLRGGQAWMLDRG